MTLLLDVIVIIIIIFSAILAMIRGFSRELLSLFCLVLAGLCSWFFYKPVLPFTSHYISSDNIATFVTIITLFLVTLILSSILTVKISDRILESPLGPLDRTLGFLFGAVRGILILAVLTLFLNNLIAPPKQPTWLTNSKSIPLLQLLGYKIEQFFPHDLFHILDEGLDAADKPAHDRPNSDVSATEE